MVVVLGVVIWFCLHLVGVQLLGGECGGCGLPECNVSDPARHALWGL